MVGLYKDPKGEKIFMKGTVTTNLPTQTMDELKKRVTELEAIVVNKGVSDVSVYQSKGNFYFKFSRCLFLPLIVII